MDPNARISSRECLSHPWTTAGGTGPPGPVSPPKITPLKRSATELRRILRIAQHSVCFMVRLKNLKQLKLKFDRGELD